VVPYPAGGPTDVLARALAAKMGDGLGQQMVVDNKPGGAGNIGSEIGAKAAPDGYTPTMGNNATHATNQTLIAATPFDASKDFAAIGLTTTVTHVLVVHPDVPATTIREFAAWAQIRANKLRALAVSSLKRHANLPDVPTVDETIVKGFQPDAWFGLFAPARTPDALVARLNAEMVKALRDPATAEVIAKAGFDITSSNPAELADFVKVEIVKWAKVVKDSGAKAE
jgi:tripartite-type tricarboxylate transporter receptor subunit TctC